MADDLHFSRLKAFCAGQENGLPHRVLIQRNLTENEIYERVAWCKDPGCQGGFSYRYHAKRTDEDHGLLFEFTNPDVAFEFKIRWG